MKICTKCKIEKDENEFCKDKGSKNGLQGWCKSCFRLISENKRGLYHFCECGCGKLTTNKKFVKGHNAKICIKINKFGDKVKLCPSCKTEKSIDKFNKRNGIKSGLQSHCKECQTKDREKLKNTIKEITEYKICIKCLIKKSKNEFYTSSTSKDNLSRYCKICDRDIKTKYRKNNKERIKNYSKKYRESHKQQIKESTTTQEYKKQNKERSLKYLYNLDIKKYNDILILQNNSCKICNISFQKTKICVDHDHLTGKIRGLLCRKCNTGIGLFNDSIILLNKATIYLSQISDEQKIPSNFKTTILKIPSNKVPEDLLEFRTDETIDKKEILEKNREGIDIPGTSIIRNKHIKIS